MEFLNRSTYATIRSGIFSLLNASGWPQFNGARRRYCANSSGKWLLVVGQLRRRAGRREEKRRRIRARKWIVVRDLEE